MLTTCVWLGAQGLRASETPTLDGVWQSDGYAFVLEIDGDNARLFGVGRAVCLPETDDMVPLADLLPGADFGVSGGGQRLTIGFPLEPHRISARRLPSLPAACEEDVGHDPISTFSAFAGFFDANYPFFALYDVDWPDRVAQAQGRIHVSMSDKALFAELKWLIRPIRDGHVALIAEIDGTRQAYSPNRARILQSLEQAASAAGEDPGDAVAAFRQTFWYDSIPNHILGGKGRIGGNDRIQYGMLTGEIGYLAFATMGGFAGQGDDPEENLSATQSLLDDIMTFFSEAGAQAMILDISLNFGGEDYISREVASRFLHDSIHAYTKYAADAENPIETRVNIAPSSGVHFDGEVFLVTSNVTVSAAEILTLTLRKQPHVTQVGEATRGALSDALSRSLPNGWQINLSNEVYLDAASHHWEGLGIPPDVQMPVFLEHDPIESHRQAIHRLAGR